MPVNTAASVINTGSYFTANNGATGIATPAAPTSYSDTAPLFTIQNTNSASGRSIYLDWMRAYCTVAGTAGVAAFLKLELDHITPTGGTLLVPASSNTLDSTASGAAIRLLPTGIAATANMRLVVGNQWVVPTQTAVFTVNTEFNIKFGGVDGYGTGQIGAAAAGLTRTFIQMPPVVIAPTWCLQVPFIFTLQSAASTWAFEFGWVES
jgi:hypothetical protein